MPPMRQMEIPVSKLNVDQYNPETGTGYQRPVKLTKKDLLESFDPFLCRMLNVVERPDGTYWVVDGQQRLERAKEWKIKKLTCGVVKINDVQKEADLFVELNMKTKTMTPLDLWFGRLARGEGNIVMADIIVREAGYKIMQSSNWKCISCPNAIIYCLENVGIVGFQTIIKILDTAWRSQKNSKVMSETALKAMAHVLLAGTVDEKEMIRKLSKKNFELLFQQASTKHATQSGVGFSRHNYLATVIVDIYNKRMPPDKKLKLKF